ncbi:MAG: adenosine kinase [Bacteroidales bacterium]|nr:adenosine kinase [Bacteroidales bacterium]MBN2698364.1 adenosine kinase [Bacteroidales bacterium]
MSKVLGMGNALVDIITQLKDDKLLESFGLPKGSMTLVDLDTSNIIHAGTAGYKKQKASGGSAANTIHGLAHLGINTGFIGKVGNDELGRFFQKDMKNSHIQPILFRSVNETGRAMALVSPDSERTFATFLGAAVELTVDDLSSDIFRDYDYFYIEGYLVQNKPMMEKALRLAVNQNLTVCLDLSSYNIVEQEREFFFSLIKNYVDVLFANEEEVQALTGRDAEEGSSELNKMVNTVVVKMGARGSLIRLKNDLITIEPRRSKPIDTTGAGDLYASGFIYGLIRGCDPETCGRMGSALAGRIIEFIGAKMTESSWENLRREINSMESACRNIQPD